MIGLFVGSIDRVGYDDLGLVDQIKNVADSENGYFPLAYTQKEGFRIFSDDDSSELLRQHVYHEVWDKDFVTQKVIGEARHIENAISSLSYPYFKFPTSKDVDELPDYLTIMTMARLIIVKSMHEAKSGKLDEAIQYAGYSITLSQKIKTESNNLLISHMIGLVMQYEALVWVSHLAVDYELNSLQYKKLLMIFDRIPSYQKDSFSQVFSGEFVFAKNMIDTIVDRPFKQRWQEYWQHQDWWNTDLESGFGFGDQSIKENLFGFLQAMFPYYYVHKHRMLNESAKYYTLLSNEAEGFCKDVSLPEYESADVMWLDLLKPNALTGLWINSGGSFYKYITRRCLSHAHIEATKASVAVLRYRNDHGKVPQSLQALVPYYLLSVPIDPFDGNELRYSAEKGYVYSVGTNFNDDGGAVNSYFVKRCEQSDLCSSNPTFPVQSTLKVTIEGQASNSSY